MTRYRLDCLDEIELYTPGGRGVFFRVRCQRNRDHKGKHLSRQVRIIDYGESQLNSELTWEKLLIANPKKTI